MDHHRRALVGGVVEESDKDAVVEVAVAHVADLNVNDTNCSYHPTKESPSPVPLPPRHVLGHQILERRDASPPSRTEY